MATCAQRRRHAITSSHPVAMYTSLNHRLNHIHAHGYHSMRHLDRLVMGNNIMKYRGSSSKFLGSMHQSQFSRHPPRHSHTKHGVRFVSKFSTDPNEAVAQDSTPSHDASVQQQLPASKAASTTCVARDEADSTKPSIDYLKPATTKMRNLLALKESYVTLSKACVDAQVLLNSNADASSPDELVAMADYFLVLVNSVELESSIETIQKLQYNAELVDGDSVTREVLEQAVKAMRKLHYLFVRVVEYCVPPTNNTVGATPQSATNEVHSASFVPCVGMSKYSTLTMGRALQVSRRAEEMGMPMHKPLYQRMACGIVLTSPLPLPVDPGQWPWDQGTTLDNNAGAKVGRDDISALDSNGLHKTPLTLELQNLFQRAKVALRCSFSPSMPLKDQIEQSHLQNRLEQDMYTEPWLLLLKRRQFEDALGLLHVWQDNSGATSQSKPSIALLPLLGENTILKALDIAKDWVVGTDVEASFPTEVSTNPHANELVSLLQQSTAQILSRRKASAEQFSRFLSELAALQIPNGSESDDPHFDDEFSDGDDTDFDDDDDFEDFDSDSDDDEDENNALEALSKIDVTRENFPRLLKGFGPETVEVKGSEPDRNETSGKVGEINIDFVGDDSSDAGNVMTNADRHRTSQHLVDEAKEQDSEPPIIEGFSNKEVRRSIYLRKGPDWELPDIVSQLEDWNRGKPLTFTPEFEKHLGIEMTKDEDDDRD